ncbi:uncharacterized protein LOC123720757 isoform X2 [Pieris brassicae]|uniref:uncharacterized protein LOC123720757 isoform X2 n=1 Tax=Pieris brassicae TaxID=7116 RepID=UPI001E660883|nr:uncharacterized protein LOC123720757 isoform X2 [Pieris brassicae]
MIILFLTVCLGLAGAQILQDGQCEAIALQNNFELHKFTGNWHGLRGNSILQNGDCSYINITPTSSGNYQYTVEVGYVEASTRKEIRGTAVAEGSSASLNLTLEGKSTDFNVINTDYDNYALVYSCENVGDKQRNVYIWELARETSFSDETFTSLVEQTIASNFGLTPMELSITSHSEAICNVETLNGPVIIPGTCDQNVPFMEKLNLSRFSGEWRLIASYYNERQSGECNHAVYTVQDTHLAIENRHVLNRELLTTSGSAVFASNEENGKLRVTVGSNTRDYWILTTDYESYALAYSCENLANNQRRINSWKLSRTNELTPKAVTDIDTVVNQVAVLDNSRYITTNQSSSACFYYPVLNPNEPVILPGQCDLEIPAVGNFNFTRFEGEWLLLSSYYNARQSGECNRARYTNRGTTMGIVNSHVTDRLRSISTGTASTTAESGKLIVNVGTNSAAPFWILATDYENHALAYSCENLPNNRQRISSWKLSRSDTFSARDNEIMNNVINSVDVLNNRYYNDVDQSDKACFHYPTLLKDEPVILPGQCEVNVPVIPSLNLTKFSGEWRLVSSYYNERQSGECNHAIYSVQQTGLSLQNRHVLNRQLFTTSGTIAFASTDRNGKLRATVGSNTRDYWILNTDYDSYALAYSCENLENNQQRIYSWKLSRTNSLTAEANETINEIIDTVDALHESYFTKADQSVSACFHYPDIQVNEPVIFEGQCNQNILVTNNFSLERFSGEWRLIASYYNERQSGECNHAVYTVQDTHLAIENRHVLNRELLTTSGSAVFASNEENGKLRVTVGSNTRDYWILTTDYESYALAYSCENLANNQRRINSWKLSRTNELTPKAVTDIDTVVNQVAVLDNSRYITTNQSSSACFYYPVLNPNEPVILPGQCDLEIPAVGNFNFTRFEGEWLLLSSYYNARQSGECNRARYTNRGTTMGIVNSHVTDRLRSISTGTASTTAESGKLIVNVGTNSAAPFWILATDYENHALAYSCENLPNNRQRISSWKLSRSDTFSARDNEIMNNVINSVDVLNNRYYNDVDQSDKACFHYPTLLKDEPVILPGQCEVNVPVIPSLNLTKFSGEWRLVSSYYNERQSGECNHAIYSVQQTGLSLQNRHVLNRQLFTTSGTIAFASTDRNGKLRATVGSNTRDYWILNTDYDSYALAYSCENLENNQQRIYSWKLSRTNSLTAEANETINEIIDTVDALHESYFTKADQSVSACFHYPDIQVNEPVIFEGQCNQNILVTNNFSLERFSGEWRLIASYYNERQSGECNHAVYTVQDTHLAIENRHVLNRELLTTSGSAVFASNEENGKLRVTVGSNTRDYWILTTDYESYALAYSCENLANNQRRINSWKLSRTNELTPKAVTDIDTVVNQVAVLDNNRYIATNQSSSACFYYPVLNPNEPVILPGQCDLEIPAVGNFNFTRFEGEWLLLSSYYNARQSGECNRARYTNRGTTMGIVNSHVTDRLRSISTGTASTTAESGKLIVNVGTNSAAPFWILATDYENHALAYSCENLPNNRQRISSWKLGRSDTFSARDNEIMNNVINSVDVLNNRYYNDVDQSDKACFHYPTLLKDEPVILPGQCEVNVPVIPSLNLTKFSGEWRLVSSYYNERQSGECNHAIYSVQQTGLSLQNRHVLNRQLFTTSGTIAFASTDRNGKLRATVGSNTRDYWILNTDYDSYALAYSCENLENNQQRIYSWKLSRTNSLTAEANETINEIIDTVDALHESYFTKADQSVSACFHYPDIQVNEPVIFEGQCNQNILVTNNFSLERFSGEWRLIASYYNERQSGECNHAVYTVQDTHLAIENRHVLNRELLTTSGSAVFASNEENGKLRVTVGSNTRDYWILTTDYESYALAYSCENLANNQRRINSWKLSRTNELTPKAVTDIDTVVNQVAVLDNNRYIATNQSSSACFYYPVLNPNEPVILPGQCDLEIPAVGNFNFTRFEGEWLLLSSYYNARQSGECNRARYTNRGTTMGIVNSHVTDRLRSISTGTASTTAESGKLIVNVGTNSAAPFWILATDYENHALAYSCENLPNNRQRISSWKLGRSDTFSARDNEIMNNVINSVDVLNNRYYNDVDQSDKACFHYPTLLKDEPVILPGQCEVNVPVIPSLNLTKFSGEWRLVSSYYNERQSGECNHAIYSVQQTGLSLQNRHVLNRQLFTTSGTIAFASTDRNGKLRATVGSNTRDYWILNTDYDSYALAYSCENLENNQQRIYSWKLSRTNSLTAEANETINEIIDTVDALHESYFTKADQSVSACFHYPDIQVNEPVIFEGQCNQNILVTNNFSLERFSGEWRLIETYYNERQRGVCNKANYAVQGDTLNIINSHVVGDSLLTVAGTGRFASQTVRDAKLLVTVGTRSSDFWILDTDYDSYALAYSCQNLDSNEYRVFSWKLSRNDSLSADAIERINRVYDRVPELNDRFFSDVDQSVAACFYMPEIDESKPVVFKGQCDQTIQVIRDFDANRYMGQWYDIESYPSSFQYGTCNSAFYTRQGNFVDVVNTQVVNGTISVRQGVGSFVENERTSKLSLNFGSTPRDYWVLSTDYSTYALVYSCLNIDEQNMQVGAWKLSKTRQLTQSAQTTINNRMDNIRVLDSRYFIERDHTSAGCTFNNEIQQGDPVYLQGTCPTNVSPVANFNMTQFVGTWYEVEIYPTELWGGQCSLQQFFTAGADSLSFTSRGVNNQELVEISGTASRVSGSENGQLTITLETDTGTVSVPFTVLSVEYQDYALAYGCVQLTNNLRRVYSWKLSRSRTLSSNANTGINAIVLANDLVNRYYVKVDHSNAGCFFLPDTPLGQPVILPGQCDPNIHVVDNFTIDGFLGRWRLISSYYTHRQSGECNQLDYSREGTTIRVRNMHIIDSELRTVSGSATVSADGTGKLRVSVSTRTVDFWILATDYENYALAYSCSNVNADQMRVYSWKLSRTTTLGDTAEAAINNVVDQINVLNERFYATTDNSGDACFYYPPVDSSRPVVFDGQCDPNISVVRNFQSNLFLGEWYDIESYPSTFQYGTCNTARYSANGNNILVNNTQIIDGVVSVRVADGVFSEGNNVGKLKVNFGSADRDYWILVTDYNSYALVYSCLNLDDKTKQVGTWKLSRNRQLSETALSVINSTMSTIRELDQRFFIKRNHTEAGCFYHRDQSQTSVIFSGRCDTTISAVPNFNLTAFQGVWHEIQAYPSEMMTGECLSQEYSQGSGSALNVVQRNVRHETLFERTGVVTQTSNDNSGKLLITVQGGLGATIPFWVLSTDYTDYALAYGCVDLINNERQVYSWKLSRHQQLSAAANIQIENVKASIPVLDSKYYKNINQSNAACFHLPDFTPGESVILPGQCDANIPVERNFDAQRYSGVWYQIEKYFQRFETGGNCTGARYTLDSDTGVVTVLNWQVVNGIMDTIEGTATVNSTDGSAKLRVRLPIRSSDPNNPEFRETNLYVLNTDYTSYSLAYSCVNLEGNRRQVSAWKLSRARTMSDAGNAAINAYMANRQELQNSYFVAVDQSDSCPEPSSATLVKNSIIMIAMLCISLVYMS